MHIVWICLAVQIYNNYMHTASCRITAILIYSVTILKYTGLAADTLCVRETST